ncbi:MAG: DUF4386 domain-containing protein [Miltoncostaeaceae bacterium]
MTTQRTHITPTPPSPTTPGHDAVGARPGRSPRSLARLAGLLYLVIVVAGLFAELVVRGSLVEPGDAAATAQNILADATLFRLGFVADLVMVLADIGVAILFYVLLKPVNHGLALLALVLRLMMDAVLAANLMNHLGALLLLDAAGPLATVDPAGRAAQALMALESHRYGYLVALVFFGLHVAVLGWLFARSTFLPRILGILLGIAGAGYLLDSFSWFLIPGYDGGLTPVALAPVLVAEIAVVGWLLAKGLDEERWLARAREAALPAAAR